MKHIYLLHAVFLFFILLGFLYSRYKKDGIYSSSGTLATILTHYINIIFMGYFLFAYYLFYTKIYLFFGYPGITVTFLHCIMCLILVDFCIYVTHRISHTIPAVWMFHFVHHADSKLNLSTSYRVSFIDVLYTTAPLLLMVMIGFPLSLALFSYTLSISWNHAAHSKYFRLPKFLELFFVSYNSHKIHHDQQEKNHMSNYGSAFIIWDRMFDTYVEEVQDFKPGIKGYEQNDIIKIQLDPIIKYFKKQL